MYKRHKQDYRKMEVIVIPTKITKGVWGQFILSLGAHNNRSV